MSPLSSIKSELRLYMNGVLAQSLRERGLRYRLIFGVELPRLKEIAARYEPDHDLAQALWKEDIRECRILAGYLQPVDSFLPEIADIWLDAMHDTEIIDYTCMSLFRRLPYAKGKAFQWIASEAVLTQYAGFRLMAHLLPSREGGRGAFSPRDFDELDDQIEAVLASPSVPVFLRALAQDVRDNL
jgi:hypothetical protein